MKVGREDPLRNARIARCTRRRAVSSAARSSNLSRTLMTSSTPAAPDVDNAYSDIENDSPIKAVYRFNIPPRFYILPVTAFVVGSCIGIVRGTRTASLRFLAENVHRPPRTVQGWYFYNKTKNYRVLLGGLKGAGAEASKLVLIALGWVGIEEGFMRIGWGGLSQTGAGMGTAGLFSAIYRLPWKGTQRTLILGLVMGSSLDFMKWGREYLEKEKEKIDIDRQLMDDVQK